MAEATPNPFNAVSRPPLWLVTYDLAPVFFDLKASEQYKAELADAEIGVQLLLERIWKAAYTTTDLKTGWLLLKVANRAEAETVVRREQMYEYFTNLKYTPVYSATQAGFNLKIIWGGLKRFLRARF